MNQMVTAKLGDPGMAEVIHGQSPPSSVYNPSRVGLPFFQGKAAFMLVSPSTRVCCRTGKQFARPFDALVSVRAPVGEVNIATEDCAIGGGLTATRAGRRVGPWFFALDTYNMI